jgi:hypothetical protein
MNENIFDKTKERIKKYGHHKGDFHSDKTKPYTSSSCLLGALRLEAGLQATPPYVAPIASELLKDVISEQYPDRLNMAPAIIPSFNDHPDTTLADIIAVLEKASVRAQEQI